MKRILFGVVAALLCATSAFATALSITAANVSLDSGPSEQGIAGEAFVAGAILYYKESDGRWYKAQCDGTAAEAGSAGIGMALGTADAAGARIVIARPGAVVSIGTGTAAMIYLPGRTAGSLIPSADLAQTDKATIAALGIGSNKLLLTYVYNAGAVVP